MSREKWPVLSSYTTEMGPPANSHQMELDYSFAFSNNNIFSKNQKKLIKKTDQKMTKKRGKNASWNPLIISQIS